MPSLPSLPNLPNRLPEAIRGSLDSHHNPADRGSLEEDPDLEGALWAAATP